MKLLLLILMATSFAQSSNAADRDIETMLKEFNGNQARFRQKYINKSIEKTGLVKSVIAETSIERKMNALSNIPPIFLISLDVSGSKVSCFINDEATAVKLNAKDLVKFSGIVSDVNSNVDGIQVSKCRVEIIKPTPLLPS